MPRDFSSTEIYSSRLDLNEIPVFIERDGSNPMFLEVKELPEILTYGKHYGTLAIKVPKGQKYWLRPNSRIQFEVKDSKGNVIFSDLVKSGDTKRSYSGALIFYIWIRENTLRTFEDVANGIVTLTFVGELSGVQWST